MASKRIWTDMFKLQHDTPPLTQAESEQMEQRTTQTKARWNPLKEQIDILESVFNSGIENPNREEIRRITARLRNIGEVGDANVFYWFQNRKSRKKKRQRRMDAAKEKANRATSGKPTILPDTIQPTTPNPPLNHITSARNPNQTRSTPNSIHTIVPNTIQTMVPNPIRTNTQDPIQTMVPNSIQVTVPNSIQAIVPNPIRMNTMENPNFSTLSAPVSSFPTITPSVSSFGNQQMQQTQQVFTNPFVNLQQDAMFGGVATNPYNYNPAIPTHTTTNPYNYNPAIPAFPENYPSLFLAPEKISYQLSYYQNQEAVMPSAPTVTHLGPRLGYHSDDLMIVSVDGNKYRAPRGPIDVRAAFGPNKFLVDINCQRIPADDRGFTLHGLHDGGSYYVLDDI